jgi:iron complex transport system ATP-binding protein
MSELVLSGLGVSFGDRIAVAGVDVTVAAGEWLALVGPNGSGKTSLLRAVAGTIPHRGSVLVDGAAVATMSPRRVAAAIAMVPQHRVLPDDMSVLDYTLLGGPRRGRRAGHCPASMPVWRAQARHPVRR